MKQPQTNNLTGIDGLALSVIYQAIKDARRNDEIGHDARTWFYSPDYQFWASMLNIQPGMIPTEIINGQQRPQPATRPKESNNASITGNYQPRRATDTATKRAQTAGRDSAFSATA